MIKRQSFPVKKQSFLNLKQSLMVRRLSSLSIILLFTIALTGCWGAKEIDEAAYAFALGIDAGPGKNIIISTAILNPGGNVSATGSTNQSLSPGRIRVFTAEAPSIFSGINIINTMLERQIELGHLKMVIFGETLARQGIESYLETIVRWRKLRRTIYIAVARGEARRVIESVTPPAGDNVGKLLEMMFITQGFVGFTPRNQMLQFYNAHKTKGDVPIAALVASRVTKYDLTAEHETRVDSGLTDFATDTGDPGNYTAGNPPLSGEAPLQFLGTAVLNRGKLVQKLTGNETIAFSLLRGEFNRAYITIPDPETPDKLIQLEISQIRRPQIKLIKEGNQIRTKAHLHILGEVVGIQSNRQYELPQNVSLLERQVKQWVKKQSFLVFQKAQAVGCDIFGFGNYARWLVPDWESWQKWDWISSFKTMRLDLTVNVHVERPGLIVKKNALKEE
jgi:spore germination protein KC